MDEDISKLDKYNIRNNSIMMKQLMDELEFKLSQHNLNSMERGD